MCVCVCVCVCVYRCVCVCVRASNIDVRKLMQEYGSNQQDRYAYKMMTVISRFYKV